MFSPLSFADITCGTTCGRTDGGWELNLNIYDIAAGMLIVQEAGRPAEDVTGEDGTHPDSSGHGRDARPVGQPRLDERSR